MELKFEKGELKFNVADLFRTLMENLDEDGRREFLEDLFLLDNAYQSFIYTARQTYTASNYNADYFKLFKDFFLMAPEFSYPGTRREIIRTMSTALKAILEDAAKVELENRKLRTGKYAFLDHVRQLTQDYSQRLSYDEIRRLYDEHHVVKDKFAESRRMNEKFDLDKLTAEWVDALFEAFGKKKVE